MSFPSRRRAVSKVLVGVIVVVIIGLAAVALVASRGASNSSTTTTSSTTVGSTPSPGTTSTSRSTTSGTSAGTAGLNVTKIYVDIIGAHFVPPSVNSTSTGSGDSYVGSVGDAFTVDVNLVYNTCVGASCPSNITAVNVAPLGFTVQDVDSGNGVPVPIAGTGQGSQIGANFIVSLTGPSTPFTGAVTIQLTIG